MTERLRGWMSQEHEDLALIRSRTTGSNEPWLPSQCKQELSEGSWWTGAMDVEVTGEQYLEVSWGVFTFTAIAPMHQTCSCAWVTRCLMGHSSPWWIQLSNVTLPGAPLPYDKCKKNSVILCHYKESSFCFQMRCEQNLHSWLRCYNYETGQQTRYSSRCC